MDVQRTSSSPLVPFVLLLAGAGACSSPTAGTSTDAHIARAAGELVAVTPVYSARLTASAIRVQPPAGPPLTIALHGAREAVALRPEPSGTGAAPAALRAHDVEPGVDLVFRTRGGRLEYVFEVEAGTPVSAIELSLGGHERAWVDAAGDLVMETRGGRLVQRRPVAFQGADPVESHFEVSGRLARIVVGPHDPSRGLVVDPIVDWSADVLTAGGRLPEVQGSANAIATGPDGSVVVVGDVALWDFGPHSAIVKAFASDGRLRFTTEIGSYRDDNRANGVAVDASGNVYVAGSFANLAASGAPAPCLVELGPDGAVTTLFASDGLELERVALDGAGAQYVTGTRGPSTAVVAKIVNGAEAWESVVDTTGTMRILALAVDHDGHAIVGGWAQHGDGSGIDRPWLGGVANGTYDGFVARFAPDGGLELGRYVGGSSGATVWLVAAADEGRIVVAGVTMSLDLPHYPGPATPPQDNGTFVGILEHDGSMRPVLLVGPGDLWGLATTADGIDVGYGVTLARLSRDGSELSSEDTIAAGDTSTPFTDTGASGTLDHPVALASASPAVSYALHVRGSWTYDGQRRYGSNDFGVQHLTRWVPSFSPHRGTDTSVSCDVGSTEPVLAVEASADGGAWVALASSGGGTWSGGLQAPPSSAVRFRARNGAGDLVASGPYYWPYAVPFPDHGPFAATFVAPRGNTGWVEVDVAANAAVASVSARLDGRAPLALSRTPWASWASNASIPAGSSVTFAATDSAGDTVTSQAVAWPPATAPAGGGATTMTGGASTGSSVSTPHPDAPAAAGSTGSGSPPAPSAGSAVGSTGSGSPPTPSAGSAGATTPATPAGVDPPAAPPTPPSAGTGTGAGGCASTGAPPSSAAPLMIALLALWRRRRRARTNA